MKKETLNKIKDEIESCKRPLIFFHDDSDGLASFLLIYKHVGDGKGVVVKTKPEIDEKFLRKVEEYGPDKIFIVDIAMVKQEFADECKNTPIVWIDHHMPVKIRGTKYFNPRLENPKDNAPVSQVLGEALEENLWVSLVGAIGDWQLPPFAKKFSEEHPDLLPSIKTVEKARFETKLGELISIFNSLLKGKTQDVMTSVKILSRINDPYELLDGKTPRAKFLIKRYSQINKEYRDIMDDVGEEIKKQRKEKVFVFSYSQDKMSFTGDIANEVVYRNPKKKIILVCRQKSGEMKCSLRTTADIKLNEVLGKFFESSEGYGGGHEKTCGACLKVGDFCKFIEYLKREAKDL